VWNCKFATVPTNKAERSTWPSGTKISVRIADEVNSSHNHPGDLVTGLLNRPYIPEFILMPSVLLTLEESMSAGAELR
jgi:hypothetical protein